MCPSIVPTIVSQTGFVVLVVAVVAAAAVVVAVAFVATGPGQASRSHPCPASPQSFGSGRPHLRPSSGPILLSGSASGCYAPRNRPRVAVAMRPGLAAPQRFHPPNHFSYFFSFLLQDFFFFFRIFLNFVDVSRCSWFSAVFAVTIRFPLKSSFRGKRLHPKRIDSDAKSRRFSIFH